MAELNGLPGESAWSSGLARYAKWREKDCPKFKSARCHYFFVKSKRSSLMWDKDILDKYNILPEIGP